MKQQFKPCADGHMSSILQATDPLFSSLHMGESAVLRNHWIGTCLQLEVMSGEPLQGVLHMLVIRIRHLSERKRQRRAATCHTLYHEKKPPTTYELNQAPSVILLLHGRTEENNLLPSAANITWYSLTVGDLIFHHKGSRRASASERILAELGTFHGPGPRGAFMPCRVSGMLFPEEPRLLPASLE